MPEGLEFDDERPLDALSDLARARRPLVVERYEVADLATAERRVVSIADDVDSTPRGWRRATWTHHRASCAGVGCEPA